MEALRSQSMSAILLFVPLRAGAPLPHFRLLVPCWRNHNAKQPAHISACISYVVSVKERIFTLQFGAV